MNKINEKKLKQKISELKNNTKNLSLEKYAESLGHSKMYFYDTLKAIKKLESLNDLEKQFLELCSNVSPSLRNFDIETDDRANTEIERDENGLIQYYSFEIFRKNNPTLRGKLSRTEMETIYKLYSIYGANLTQKIVSREFPQYTFVEFKRILRAFNIYKSDSEFPLHMLEEKTEEELINLHNKNKENNFLRSIEKDELSEVKKLLKKYMRENQELKNNTGLFKFEISNDVQPIYNREYVTSNNSLILYLSDLHVGATLETGSLYENDWNEKELKRRLQFICDKISSFGHLETLIINILGDSLDGMDGMTARRDHIMPQNMDNKQQVKVFIDRMIEFIGNCIGLCNDIKIYCVPNGNHGGDFEWLAHQALKYAVEAKFPEIEFTLFEKFFGHYTFNSHNWLVCHGKDSKFMKKPFPLHLDPNTSSIIKDYIISNNIPTNNLHIVKGDLHSEAFDDCSVFDYRNVLSLFGSSDYSMYNYQKNNYGISYDLFIGNNLVRGTFQDF